jgi:hypothetical protein
LMREYSPNVAAPRSNAIIVRFWVFSLSMERAHVLMSLQSQAIQRRYQNVVKDSTRQLQYNMILGRKLCVAALHPHTPYTRSPFAPPCALCDSLSLSRWVLLVVLQRGLLPFARAESNSIRVREQLSCVLAQDRAVPVL